jgi:hypothetical protein
MMRLRPTEMLRELSYASGNKSKEFSSFYLRPRTVQKTRSNKKAQTYRDAERTEL